MSEVEVKKEKLKELFLKCKEGIDKISYDEKNLKSNSFVLDVNRLPFQKEEIEEVLIQLFKTEIENEKGEKVPLASLKDMKKIGIPDSMIDSVSAKRWLDNRAFDGELEFVANISDHYLKAFVIIGRIYGEKEDRSGNPQSWHLKAVSDALDFKNEKIVGLLHDVVEDGYLTLDSLRYIFKFPESIVQDVSILTRDKELYPTYDDYIRKRILPSRSLRVLNCKLKDMLNNQSDERTKALPAEARHKAKTKYISYIPLVEKRIEEEKKIRKRSKEL